MPTAHPRYAITDTGAIKEALDLAADAYPDKRANRRELLMALVERGAAELARDRRRAALRKSADLIDSDVLLGDEAWR